MSLKFLNSRKFRQGTVATAITVLTVAVIVVANMVMTALSERFMGLTIDMTQDEFLSLSEESEEFLNSLSKDVKIYILNNEESFVGNNVYTQQANEIIKNYGKASSKVSVEYIDLVKDPTFEAQYPDMQLTTNTILVTSGTNAVTVSSSDLFNQQQNYYGQSYIASSKAEQTMATAILNVTAEKKIQVVFLEGHSEDSMDSMKNMLTANAYEISTQNLLTEEIDPEATIAVLSTPLRDLEEEELRKLDRFLNNEGNLGKTLVYFAGVQQPETPNLNAFLGDWGVRVEEGVVYETNTNNTWNGNPYIIGLGYTESDYSANVAARSLIPVTAYARPLSLTFDWNETDQFYSRGSIYMQVLQNFSETVDVNVNPFDDGAEEEAVIYEIAGMPALTHSYRVDYQGTTRIQSNVVVSNSYQTMDNTLLSVASFSNSEYYLQLLNTLAGKEESIYIQDKTRSVSYLDSMSDSTANRLSLVFMIFFPLAVLITGVVIWLRRRHR